MKALMAEKETLQKEIDDKHAILDGVDEDVESRRKLLEEYAQMKADLLSFWFTKMWYMNVHVGKHCCHENTVHIAMYSNLPVHDTVRHYTLHYNMKAILLYLSVLDLTRLEMDKVRYCNHITKYSRKFCSLFDIRYSIRCMTFRTRTRTIPASIVVNSTLSAHLGSHDCSHTCTFPLV